MVDPCEPLHSGAPYANFGTHQLKSTGLEQRHKRSPAFDFQYEQRPRIVVYRSF